MIDTNKLKEYVKDDRKVHFVEFFDDELWYKVDGTDFKFPIPLKDTKGARFLASDRSILFMRWMRKHMEQLDFVRPRKEDDV